MVRPRVLFLCSDNSCRTQMAEAFLRNMAGERFEVVSAGAEASSLDPEAVAAMGEVGFDISAQTPKKVDLFLRERFTYLVSLFERDIERTCPIFPGAIWRLKWPVANPAALRDSWERRAATRRIRDEIREYVAQFVQEHS